MEESEKRRERLKAMRMEAAQVGVRGEDGYSGDVPRSLANPLLEASATPSVHAGPDVARRFDYYTDPMSAFSTNKSWSKVSHQMSPDSFTPPRPRNVDTNPANQAQATYGPDQRMFPDPGSYRSYTPSGSSMGSPSTFGTPPHGMNVGCGTFGFPSNLSRGGNFPRADFVQSGCPSIDYGESRGYGFNNNPQTGSGNWGRPYPHSGRGRSQWLGGDSPQIGYGNSGNPQIGYGNSGSPQIGYGNSGSPQIGYGNLGSPHSGRGRSQWMGGDSPQIGYGNSVSPQIGYGNLGSPHHQSGRGRSHWRGSNNPGSKQSGRRVGSHDNVSAELRPDLYYSKSMVEDPWKMLKPVIRKKVALRSLDTADSVKPWLPKSISSKKARVSETSIKYASGKSLAEELAASFHAAANYEPDDNSAKDNV